MIHVDAISRQVWTEKFSENAHAAVFKKNKPASWDRIDYALVVANDGEPMGYVTCRDHDEKTVYWAHGGSFPGTRNTIMTWQGYQAFVEWCKLKGYERITTLIENDNCAMLKMAMKVGFRIRGIRCYQDSILLEHVKELK